MRLSDILRICRPHNGAGEAYLARRIQADHSGMMDAAGNVIVQIGTPTVCFCAHLDTVDWQDGTKPVYRTADDLIYTAQSADCLGADDGAGIFVLLRMIAAKTPGLYAFFAGEEAGAVGSRAYHMPQGIRAVISLDRRGTDEIITHQGGERGASDTAAAWIAAHLKGYRPSDKGTFTDSKTFFPTIPECFNLSIGYQHEHSSAEFLDLRHIRALIPQMNAAPWHDIPIERKPEAAKPRHIPAWPTHRQIIDDLEAEAADRLETMRNYELEAEEWREFSRLCMSEDTR